MQIPLTNRVSGAGGFGRDSSLSCYGVSQMAVGMHAVERAAIPSSSPSSHSVPFCSSAICFNSPSPQHDQGPPGYPVIHLSGIWEYCCSAPAQVGKRVIKASEINRNLLW